MADMMTFPKTLDEFMEQYKIVDTEQVYTNGTELVPIFRIKQWEDAHQPRKDKKFIEIVTEYPTICPYPEYEGKPYFSIRYEENGEKIEGFGTYKPEVLSEYLKEYFMPSEKPKKGKWIHNGSQWKNRFLCSNCNYLWYFPAEEAHYCPNCGSQNEMEINQ